VSLKYFLQWEAWSCISMYYRWHWRQQNVLLQRLILLTPKGSLLYWVYFFCISHPQNTASFQLASSVGVPIRQSFQMLLRVAYPVTWECRIVGHEWWTSHPRQKKMTCRFSRWRISAILDFRDPITGSLKSQGTTS